jgi:hypothetical protein
MRSKFEVRLQRAAWLLAVTLVATPHGLAGSKEPMAPADRFQPEVSAAGAPPLEGATWSLETDFFAARLAKLDDAARRAFLAQRTGSPTDPFAGRGDDPGEFLTFLLEIENRTSGSVVLQSQRCRLITNLREFRHPLDAPELESSYALLDRELPAAYRAVLPALLDGEVVLQPGQAASGLLVCRGVKANTRKFVVEVLVSTPDGAVAEFAAPYRRVKPPKDGKKL